MIRVVLQKSSSIRRSSSTVVAARVPTCDIPPKWIAACGPNGGPHQNLSSRFLSSLAMQRQTNESNNSNSKNNKKSGNSSLPPPPPVMILTDFRIPFRHSRNAVPAVTRDTMTLQEMTREVLQAPEGSLFSYAPPVSSTTTTLAIASGLGLAPETIQTNTSTVAAAGTVTDQDTAWKAADATIQKVEYVLRGLSHNIPGTIWQRRTKQRYDPESTNATETETTTTSSTSNNKNHIETVQTMLQLFERVWNEGSAYMTSRSRHLEATYGPKQQQQENNDKSPMLQPEQNTQHQSDNTLLQAGSSIMDSDDNNNNSGQLLVPTGETTTENSLSIPTTAAGLSYLNDFALPGVTMNMYQTILDAAACAVEATNASSSSTTKEEEKLLLSMINPIMLWFHVTTLMQRYELDGGHWGNANVHTRCSTPMPMNAALRTLAALSVHCNNKKKKKQQQQPSAKDKKLQDDILAIAFGCYDLVAQAERDEGLRNKNHRSNFDKNHDMRALQRNAATYRYLLYILAQQLPDSPAKKNIAYGLFRHAQGQGLIDRTVLCAFQTASSSGTAGSTVAEISVAADDNNEEQPQQQQEKDATIPTTQSRSEWLRDPQTSIEDVPSRWKRHSRNQRSFPRDATY